MGKILLSEYARRKGISPGTAKQKALRGNFETTEKMGKYWMIEEDEPYIDKRIKHGGYIDSRKKHSIQDESGNKK